MTVGRQSHTNITVQLVACIAADANIAIVLCTVVDRSSADVVRQLKAGCALQTDAVYVGSKAVFRQSNTKVVDVKVEKV